MDVIASLLPGGDVLAYGLVGSAIACAVVLVGFVSAATNRESRRRRQRFEAVRSRAMGRPPPVELVTVRRRDDAGAFDRLFKGLVPRPEKLRKRLRRTGFRITVGQYTFATIALSVAEGLLIWRFSGLSGGIAVLLGAAGGILLPHMLVGALVNRRQGKFTDEFPEGIDVVVRGLRSGLPVSETIVAVGKELSGPVGAVFREIGDKLNLGYQLEDGVAEVAAELDTPEIKFFAISLAVQRETGGNLAETLSNLADILRRRRQMKLKIKALSSEARASAYILGALPFVMFVLLFLVNRGYVIQLFEDPRGVAMLTVGCIMMAVGGIVMFRMVRFEI